MSGEVTPATDIPRLVDKGELLLAGSNRHRDVEIDACGFRKTRSNVNT